MVKNRQLKRFKKDFNDLFFGTKKGNPLLKAKHNERRNKWILYGIYVVVAISVYLVVCFYNLYNYIYGFLLVFFVAGIIYLTLDLIFTRLYQKNWAMENKFFSQKLEDFICKMRQIGLKLIIDAKSEQQAGEKPYLINRPQFLSRQLQKSNSSGSKSNFRFSQFIPKKKKMPQEYDYYIQLSSGFKIESTPQTKEQEKYIELLRSAKIIENDFYDRIHHYRNGSIIILLLTIPITIPLTILFYVWGPLVFISGVIIYSIFKWLQFSKSKIYVQALIVQGKIPINKIKLAAYHDSLAIYKKIRLGNEIKQRQKNLEKRNNHIKPNREK